MSDVNSRQEGGAHYAGAYQHWDFVAEYLGNDYLLGCATKYIWRHAKKNGLEDLRKADHYLQKAALRDYGQSRTIPDGMVRRVMSSMLPAAEVSVILEICLARDSEDFTHARLSLQGLIRLRYAGKIRRAQAEDDGPRYDAPPEATRK